MGKTQKRAAAQRKAVARKARPGKATAGRSNAFDVLGNARQRFPVLNRRVKGENRNVARARSEAVQRRKETLLQEYTASKKSNSFRDRRFGEGDDTLSLEDRMMERFRRERAKRARNAEKYRLRDEDDAAAKGGGEGLLMLTHGGRVLGEEDYQAAPEDASDSDEGENGGRLDAVAHFGGGGASQEPAKKSHRDIVQEVIARSKEQKMERLLEKEKRESAAEQLDASYKDLVGMLEFRPTRRDPAYVAPVADDYDVLQRQMLLETRRARPSDRTKTPEEFAEQEAKRLAELEKERLERAQGPGRVTEATPRTDDDLDEAGMGEAADKYINPHVFQFQQILAAEKDESSDGGGDDADGDAASEGEGEENGEDAAPGSSAPSRREKASADVEAVSEAEDSASASDEDEAAWGAGGYGLPAADAIATEPATMPYTLACPRSEDELHALIEAHASTADDVDALLHRILATNSLKLPQHRRPEAGEARARMHEFYALLLRRLEAVGDACARAPSVSSNSTSPRSGLRRQLDSLTRHIHATTADLPQVAAARWVSRLLRAQRRLEKLLGDARDGLRVSSCWPTAGRLVLLQLAGRVWPTSDRRHPVLTPASLFVGQCLAEAPVGPSNVSAELRPAPGRRYSPKEYLGVAREAFAGSVEWDVAAGTFLAALCVDWGSQATRFHPEALAFLRGLLVHFGAPREMPTARPDPGFRSAKERSLATAELSRVLDAEDGVSAERLGDAASDMVGTAQQRLGAIASPPLRTLSLFWLRHAAAAWGAGTAKDLQLPVLRLASAASEDITCDERCAVAAGVLAAVYRSLTLAIPTLSASAAAPELLAPFDAALSNLLPTAPPALSPPLVELHITTHEAVRKALEAAQQRRARGPPMRWQIVPKVIIQSVAPRLDAGDRVTLRRDKTVADREEVERRQLKRQIARERRGAKRELRRDADFLALERQREAAARRDESKAEVRRNMAWLQEQQAMVNLQVKKGGSLLKGGGSGVKKRPRIK